MQALSLYLTIGSILGAVFILFIYFAGSLADEDLSAEECNRLQSTWDDLSARAGGDLFVFSILFALITAAYPLFIIYIAYDFINDLRG